MTSCDSVPPMPEAHEADRTALKLLVGICHEWRLSSSECSRLAGCSEQQLSAWRKSLTDQGDIVLTEAARERAWLVVSIYKWSELNGLNADRGGAWIRRKNTNMHGRTALEHLLSGDIAQLITLKRYLQSSYEIPYF